VIFAEGGVVRFGWTGGEPENVGWACGVDFVEMDPAVGLAVEADRVVGGEEESRLAVGQVGENAAALVGLWGEDGAGVACKVWRGEVEQVDGPGVG
jgi:hypothetical protein